VDNPICTTSCEETPIGAWGEGLAVGTKTFQLSIGKGVNEGKITIKVCDSEKTNVRIRVESKRNDNMCTGLSVGEFLATATSVGILFHVP
jgi:hypothetical protein